MFPIRKYFLLTAIILITILKQTTFSQEANTLKAEDILKMSFADLMNIKVISASRIEQSVKDVSATVHVITSHQIKERSYFTLEEALSDLPGFQFRNIMGFNSYVFMRGAPSQNNLILLLVDGIQINELNSGGFYGGGQFNLSNIKQIEVVQGPASALYGTNAVSGIINIITKSPENNEGHISLQGGNFKTQMADFNFSNYNKEKNIRCSVSAMYKTSEKAKLGGKDGDYNWTEDMENFEDDISISSRLNTKNFNAGFVYQEKRSSMTSNFKSIGEDYLDKNTLWDIAFLNGYLKYTNNKHEKWTLNSTAYYRNSTVKPNTIDHIIKASESSDGQQVGFYRPNQQIGIENQINFRPSDKLLLIGGIVGEIENISKQFSVSYSDSETSKPAEPPKPPMQNNQLFSYYIQAGYQISGDFNFTGGMRHDFSSYYGKVITPRLGLIYNYRKFTSKLLYNKAFRSPKPWDYWYGTGNDKLKPEKMQSVELSMSYQVTKNILWGSSIYINQISDKLTKETNENVDRWINKDELNTNGFELYGNYTIKKLSFYANYTFNNSYDQDKVTIPEISKHTANAGVTYSCNSNIKFNFRANYIGKRKNPTIIPATGNNTINGALLFHGCISFLDLKDFDIQLKSNNILNTRYYHPSNRFDGRYRQAQQSYSIILTYNF